MDPGNWDTDLAGGSVFGYTLLSVILLSNIMAMLLQPLAAKLGTAQVVSAQPSDPQPPAPVRGRAIGPVHQRPDHDGPVR